MLVEDGLTAGRQNKAQFRLLQSLVVRLDIQQGGGAHHLVKWEEGTVTRLRGKEQFRCRRASKGTLEDACGEVRVINEEPLEGGGTSLA